MELTIYIIIGIAVLGLFGYGFKLVAEQYKYQKAELNKTKKSYNYE